MEHVTEVANYLSDVVLGAIERLFLPYLATSEPKTPGSHMLKDILETKLRSFMNDHKGSF